MPSLKRKELFGAVASDLKILSALPLIKKEDSEIWDDEAAKFRSKLYSIYSEVSDELPHELEHYLTDTDIRLKDSGYKERQEKFIRSLISKLETESQK